MADQQEHEPQRAGQAAYNALAAWNPAIADQLLGTDADPFHDDARLPRFYQRVQELLTEHPGAPEA
jgi:hypothetical protein